jgi:histidyl-tRNA synthetase
MPVLKKYKVKLNSKDNLECLLQELYDEACKNLVEIQNQMNKLTSSVQLNDEIMDGKAKYAKAMNDYLTNKNKAINTKLDVARLLSDVIKMQGSKKKDEGDGDEVGDWDKLLDNLNEKDMLPISSTNEKKGEKYILK